MESPYENYLSRPIEKIAHYTTIGGLKGIIENNSIWLSNIQFLNDPLEGTFVADHATKNVKRSKMLLTTENFRQIFHTHCKRAYVASFTECIDDLSQWRAYGNNGQGVCIVFDDNCLPSLKTPIAQIENSDSQITLSLDWVKYSENFARIALQGAYERCTKQSWFPPRPESTPETHEHYESEELLRNLAEAQLQRSSMAKRLTAVEKSAKIDEMITNHKALIAHAQYFAVEYAKTFPIKTDHYEAEKEIRLTLADPLDELTDTTKPFGGKIVKFRESQYGLVPYVNSSDILASQNAHLPIKEVIIGPTANLEMVTKAIKMLLNANGYDAVVKKSKIQMRI